jgi:hypothetical protein
MDETPSQLWEHRNELTAYQVWVAYRVPVRQLNLYYEGIQQDDSCRKLSECQGAKETIEHIFWECRCVQASWQLLIDQSTEENGTDKSRSDTAQAGRLHHCPRQHRAYPDDEKEYQDVWRRI